MSKYLSTSGTVLDAVLTREGKSLITENKLKITHFAFGDDEVDYGLLPDQTAIQNTPIIEGLSEENVSLESRLITGLSATATQLPIINIAPPEAKLIINEIAGFEISTLYGNDFIGGTKVAYTVMNPNPNCLDIIDDPSLVPPDFVYENDKTNFQKIRPRRYLQVGKFWIKALSASTSAVRLVVQGDKSGARRTLAITEVLASATGLTTQETL